VLHRPGDPVRGPDQDYIEAAAAGRRSSGRQVGGKLLNIEISVLIYSLIPMSPARQMTAVTTWM
jgi:hypothetical protein